MERGDDVLVIGRRAADIRGRINDVGAGVRAHRRVTLLDRDNAAGEREDVGPLTHESVMPTAGPDPRQAWAAVRMPPIVEITITSIPITLENAQTLARPSPSNPKTLPNCDS